MTYFPPGKEIEEKTIDGLLVVRVTVMIEIPHFFGHLQENRTASAQRTKHDLTTVVHRSRNVTHEKGVTFVSLVM